MAGGEQLGQTVEGSTRNRRAAKAKSSAGKRPISVASKALDSYLTAEISASAVAENLALLRRRLTPGVAICGVVKADCYGHGLATLLDVLADKTDSLSAATPDEAIRLREMGYQSPILVFFSPCAYGSAAERRDAIEMLIRRKITLTLVAGAELADVASAARLAGETAQVHVKIDSGMGRSGVLPELAPALIEQIRASDGLKLTGIYTHLASADEADKNSARAQRELFLQTAVKCGGRDGLTLHAANSAAMIDLPETHLDMVRPGIAIYGYQPSDQMHTHLPLRPAMRVWGRLMQVKDVPAGSKCGYGQTYTFAKPGRIGLAPIGYGDGYPRRLSNRAVMTVDGHEAPIRGRVSMDQVIIDLTDIPSAAVGDKVEIISPNPAAPNSVENLARLAGTIPYEITCALGPRIKRVMVS